MGLKSGATILVDTNVIVEAHRTRSWGQLARFYLLESVGKCVEETQTGFQRRRPEETIDQKLLKESLAGISDPSRIDRASLITRCELAQNIDDGERELFAAALTRTDAWLFASPDKAAMRVAMGMGWLDRLVSLEEMTQGAGIRLAIPLRENFTKEWSATQRLKLILDA